MSKDSQDMFDLWTLVHFTSGLSLGLLLHTVPLSQQLMICGLIGVGWELWENSSSGIEWWQKHGHKEYAGDSTANLVTDVLVMVLGTWFINQKGN